MLCHLIVTVVMFKWYELLHYKEILTIYWRTHVPTKLLCPTVYEEMHLQVNTLFDLDLRVKVTKNINQYPLHHVIYASARLRPTV